MNKKNLMLIPTLFIGTIIVVLLYLVALFMLEAARPTLMDMRREGNQHSQQYIETTRSHLFRLKRNYDELESDIIRLGTDAENAEVVTGMRARQDSLLDEIEENGQSIPKEEVPEGIKRLLEEEGRWTQ